MSLPSFNRTDTLVQKTARSESYAGILELSSQRLSRVDSAYWKRAAIAARVCLDCMGD